MTKGQTIWLIEHDGSKVREVEFLREDKLFVYWRYRGSAGKGSSHPKLFVRETRQMAYLDSAAILEAKIREYKEMADQE